MTRPSPPPPANHHSGHNDNHDQSQSDPTGPHPTLMHPDNIRDPKPLIAASLHVMEKYAEYTALLEEAVTNQAHELITANTRTEELEGIGEELKQDVITLRHENAMLRGENEILQEENVVLDRNLDAGGEMMQALAKRLQNLHDSVQDMNRTMQVLMEMASADEDDVQEHEHEGSGRYFEGGWEDVAELWREGPPIDRASGPEPGNRLEDRDASDMAYWFERSNAPSPEERQPRHDDRDCLRQIETERIILQLQGRLERTETRIEHLTYRLDAQETGWELAVESIPVLLGEIYDEREVKDEEEEQYCICGGHEEDEEEEEDDEPYYMWSEVWEELGSADGHTPLRGGMGGRDEDEEFVYAYGGYTNWDQADRPGQDEVATADGKDEIIQELRQKIERLEAQIRTLMDAAHRKDLSLSTDPHVPTSHDDSTIAKDRTPTHFNAITASVFYEKEKEDKEVSLRGGSSDEEPEVDNSRNHGNTEIRTFIPASPHPLCQRATSRVGDSIIKYIIVYLPPRFIIPDSTKPDLVFHSAATVYYFPTGATEEVVQQEAWKQKACGDWHWQDVEFHRIQSKQVFKSAIADMWEGMGLSWDVLTRGDWDFDEKHDEGDMYMVNDNNLFHLKSVQEVVGPHLRGGSGDEPVQSPSLVDDEDEDEEDEDDLMHEFKCIHESLMDEARIVLTKDSPELRVHAWMTVATAAQTRNCFLERELEMFREMNDSLVQDLQWHMDAQVELEERLEAAEADKRAMAEEYQDLRTLLHHLVVDGDTHAVYTCKEKKLPTHGDQMGSLSLDTIRGGDEEALQPTTSTKQNSAVTAPCDPSHSCTTVTTNSFVFYPQRSTIVFPDTPLHIYLFPYNSTLPEIHEMIKKGSGREDLRNYPYVARILEIMKIREDMGIHLPENVSDERITIDIPDITMSSRLDRETKVSAWQISDVDAEGLEKLVEKLDINSNAENSLGEGEKDYYQDVGDLINSLNDPVDTENNYDQPRLCVCQDCSVYGSELYNMILHPQSPPVSEPSPVVSFRGGGSDSEYWSHDSYGNREFPLRYPQQTPPANAPPNTPASYGNAVPPSLCIPEDEAIATSEGPLSTRLGRLMFPTKFLQQRENSIRRFDWQHIRRLSLQFKDKRSRGFRYTRSAHCEEWATQLDKHREHCDYCQGVFLEEDFTTKDSSPRHEEEAPKPMSGAGKPWEKSKWPENSIASSVTAVEDPDPRLRGGAGSEIDLEYDNGDSEDWQSEWDDLASQTQSAGCQPRRFRNFSTLSMKTAISPPSPVDRNSTLRRWPQQSNLCTAMEFIRDGPTFSEHESFQMDALEVRAGKSVHSPRYFCSDNLTGSKTSHPLLLETRGSRGELVLERLPTRYDSLQYRSSLGVSVVESDSVLDLRAENWLENPRPAPLPPSQRHSVSPSRYSQQSHDIGLTEVYESDWSMRYDAMPRELSFQSDRHEFFPADSGFSENTLRTRNRRMPKSVPFSEPLSNKIYEEHVRSRPTEEPTHSSPKPRLRVRFCERCAELLLIFVEYFNKLRQRLLSKKPKKSAPSSTTTTPAAPAHLRMDWEARQMNRGLSPLRFDKSLPVTPRASTPAFDLHSKPKEKFPAAPYLEPKEKLRAASWASVSIIERAHAIAQAHDRANGDFVSKEGGEWRIPTVAGSSDLVKEALMWLRYETESGKMGNAVFDGIMRDDTSNEYARSSGLAIV